MEKKNQSVEGCQDCQEEKVNSEVEWPADFNVVFTCNQSLQNEIPDRGSETAWHDKINSKQGCFKTSSVDYKPRRPPQSTTTPL